MSFNGFLNHDGLSYLWSKVVNRISSSETNITAKIPIASDDLPKDLGSSSPGVSSKFSRSDHVHKVPDGIVSYTGAQTLTDAQKAQARLNINAAPDGFGLGSDAKKLTEADDVNAISKSGWYAWDYDHVPKNAISLSWLNIMRVDGYGNNVHVKTVYGLTDADSYKIYPSIVRNMTYNFKTSDWQYENPPMNLGVEYRTTEMYLSKPVYVKLVNCGMIPAQGTHKDLVFSPDAKDIVSVSAYSQQRGNTLPFYDTNGVRYSIAGSGTTVMIWNYSESALDTDVYALVKYTKITD